MKKLNRRAAIWINTLLTGFFGGILLTLSHSAFHYFNISTIHHRDILSLFNLTGSWVNTWYGYLFFVGLMTLFSIVLAIVYYMLLSRINSWLAGFFYGFCLWLIFGLFIPLQWYDVTFSTIYTSYTNVLGLCSLLIYGLFIGYSISYDVEASAYDIEKE